MTDPTTAIINTLQQAYPELPAAAIAQVVTQLLRGERAAIGGNAVALTFGEGNSFDQATIRVGDIAGGDIINVTVHLSQALDPLPVARALFASLPLDRLPAPTPDLPPTSRMLLSRNPQFVGREQDLRNLALVIADLQPTVIVSAVTTGIGGIGKTSIAVEFVYRYGCYFAGGVFWIGCADPAAIASEVVACAMAMGLPVAELPLDDQVAAVRRAWQEPLPRLLIFDNCEDPQLLATWIPTVGGCRVLVTARRGEWSTGSWVPIGVLARSDSITLIQTLAPHVALADADAVAEAVGDLPLALHLAGSYLARVRGHETPPQYLERLVAVEILDHPAFVGRALRAGEALPTKHEQDVARTFALSFEQLDLEDRVDRLAHHLLMCLACLAPGELVSQELLWAMLPAGSESLDGVDALDRGILLGLVERNRDAMVRIHRLVHLYLGRSLSLTLVVDLVEDILIARTSDLNRLAYPPAMNALMPHLRWCSRAAALRTDERMAALLNETGMALVVQGQYAAAEPLLRRALSIREMTLGSTHPTTAWSIHNLAYLMESQGQYHVAEPLYLQARTIWEATLSPDHPTIAMNLHNLAVLFRAQGRYEEAEPLAQRALMIRETVFGPSHATTAWSLNNLAALFRVQGRYEDAEPLVQRALAIREAVFGPHHPITAWSLHNLAGVLKGRHQYGTAESCYRRALLIWEEALGSEHPTTAWGLITLADLLNEQGQWVEAEALVRRTLAIHERVLGSWHPDTARSLHLLGTILAKQYDYTMAAALYQRALIIREKVLGPNHVDTHQTRNCLANVPFVGKNDPPSVPFDYEVIRPILLEDLTVAERSRQTEVERTVVGNKARRFVQEGIITSTAPPDDPDSTTPMSDAPHAETYLCRSMFWRALRVGAGLVTVIGLTSVNGAVLTPYGGIMLILIVVLHGFVWVWPPMTGTVNGFQIDAQGAFWIRRWRAFERVDPATFGMIRTVASDNGRLQVSTKAVFSQGRGAWRRLVVPLHAVTARGSGASVPPGRASAILGAMCAYHGLVVQRISDTAGTWMASPTAGATTQAVHVIRTRAAMRDRLVLVSVGGVLLIGGVTLVVQTVQANRITADIQHHGIPISGQVVEIEPRGKTTWVTFRYALEAGASPRQATCRASPAIGTYRAQQTVVVRAIPARPERALAEACAAYGSSSDRVGIIMGTVLALLGMGMSCAGIRRTKGGGAAIPT